MKTSADWCIDALSSRDQIFGIQGGAGTGKTTALRSIAEIAEASTVTSPSGSARHPAPPRV